MADRLQFKEKLAGVLALAEDQNGKITVDEVEKYFEEDGLSQEQMNLVCDYLLSMKMAVIGYKQAGGTVKEAENEEQQPLSPDEQKYVEEYLRSLGDMNEETGRGAHGILSSESGRRSGETASSGSVYW